MIGITVQLDTRQLEAWAQQTTRQINRALRSAVDRSARFARSETIVALEADLNVPRGRFRKATPLVRASRMGGPIEATWDVGKSANTIRAAGRIAFRKGKLGTVSASTFSTTGGGSANLTLRRAFVIEANGGRVLMVRTGKGKDAIKVIYAGSPSTDLAQADSVPRKTWERAAAQSVTALTAQAVQNAFDGRGDATLTSFPARQDVMTEGAAR